MFSRPFWGNISCLSAKLGLVELPSTPRQANPHRSLALDHDKKNGTYTDDLARYSAFAITVWSRQREDCMVSCPDCRGST